MCKYSIERIKCMKVFEYYGNRADINARHKFLDNIHFDVRTVLLADLNGRTILFRSPAHLFQTVHLQGVHCTDANKNRE